jgi:hypothetical protein
MTKAKTTTAMVVVPTVVQQRQAVAAFILSGTLERAKPLMAALWAVEEAALPSDEVLRAVLTDTKIEPSKDDMALAERFAQAQHRGRLLDFEETVIAGAKSKVLEGSPKFFNLMGALKIIGERVDPMVTKTTIYDLRGAQFKTPKRYAKLNAQAEDDAVEGEFEEVDEGD